MASPDEEGRMHFWPEWGSQNIQALGLVLLPRNGIKANSQLYQLLNIIQSQTSNKSEQRQHQSISYSFT